MPPTTVTPPLPHRRLASTAAAAAVWIACVVGLISALAALMAGPAYRFGGLALGAAFGLLRWTTTAAIGAAGVALLAWLVLAVVRRRAWQPLAALALLLNVAVAGPPLYLQQQAQRLPKIHDISTDTRDPPAFAAVLPLRQGARNPVDYRADTAEQQRRGYPDIAPLTLALPPAEAFVRAERAARAMGWDIVAASPQALRIEATATTLLFGFEDDVVVRIRPQGGGSVVDVRSLSRIGGSDIGANAQRIRRFLAQLSAD